MTSDVRELIGRLIDAGTLLRIGDVHIADGGVGSGNAAFQCGLDESDPTGAIGGAAASVALTNSRLDSTATVPGGAAPTIDWSATANFSFAGVADYGVYVLGATTLSQTVCAIANEDCILTLPNAAANSVDVGQITDTQMRCAAFTSVPSSYFGLKVGRGAPGVAVSGTASAARCAVPPAQLLHMDGSADPTTITSASSSLCNNSNALVAGCTGYQGPFAAGQFYTQPLVSYGTVATNVGKLYAMPFFSPASGGPITQLGLDVTGVTGTKQCDVGVYTAAGGLPNTRIVDGGTITITGTGAVTGPLPSPLPLAPQTLYFLAVGCNGAVTLLSANAGGALGPTLVGAANTTSTATQISTSWVFSSGALPNPFAPPGSTTIVSGSVPNVYAGP